MTTRRDLIKWVLYAGATAALPKFALPEQWPHDIIEGISTVDKRIADLSGEPVKWRAAEDEAVECIMQDLWKQENGNARYVRVFQDMGEQTRACWAVHEIGEVCTCETIETKYVSLIQYRRA